MDIPATWSCFYAGIVALQYHPRNDPTFRMSLEECARVADAMMHEYVERKRYFAELEAICRG